MRYTNKQSGFTLIEILVVVAIIGMISVVAFTLLAQARVKGRDAKRKQDLTQLQKAVELFYNTNGRYPCSGTYNAGTDTCSSPVWRGIQTTGGNCQSAGINTTGATGYIPDLAPTFVGVLPTDPRQSQGLCAGYNYRSDGRYYKIVSNAVNGVSGPETMPSSTDPFYDPASPTTKIMVTNSRAQTSTAPCPGSTCW